jgi:hypothetical protein
VNRRGPGAFQVSLALGVVACSAPSGESPQSGTSDTPGPDGTVSNPVATAPHGSTDPEPHGLEPVTVPTEVLVSDDDFIIAEVGPGGTLTPECQARIAGGEETRALMQLFAVSHQDFIRRTLYSWTVPEQIEELRADPTLLTRSMSSNGQRGRSADLILAAAEQDEFAKLLSELRFEKRRFAWTNPWATAMGFTGEGYGDRLLAITLKEDAIVGRLLADRARLTWAFFDLAGQQLDPQTVRDHSERLAAVYFVDESDPAFCGGSFHTLGSVMREFFLCNEQMIEGWSAFTPEIQAEVERGIAALDTLSSALAGRACSDVDVFGFGIECWRERVMVEWRAAPDVESTLLGMYEQSLAFPNDLYLPRRDNLERLLERLRLVPFDEDPLIHSASE